ncbi:MAG: DNA mismatch endonuclease Vsr [Phycisphaerales bacterium]|nr:DNA mismatch endonuclease Vsr [Phycisphaerales bacterium]
MAAIRSRGNRGTELSMVALLLHHKITGWRRHPPLFGKPDFVFRTQRVVLFVDGCFWHGCPQHATQPANNQEFWQNKLAGNKRRDRLVNRTLRKKGWRVMRIWEHDLTSPRRQRTIVRLRRVLQKSGVA